MNKRTRIVLGMIPAVSLAFILAHFLRSAPALIAPDLRTELDLTPGQLASLPAAIFLGAALMQLPVGVLLDRFGPRFSMFSFMLFAALGTFVFASANNVFMLRVGLFLIGCGAAPVFMGVIVLLSRWFSRDRLATATAVSVAVGGIGMLLSASPFALAVDGYGWRTSLKVVGVITFLAAISLLLFVRDRPPDQQKKIKSESLLEVIYGLKYVLLDKRIYLFAAVTSTTFGTLITVRNLWIGPYLNDVFSLNIVERGNIIFLVSVAWLVGALVYGPLDRMFDTRRGVVTGGLLVFAGATALLAINGSSSTFIVTALLITFAVTAAMAGPLFAHVRSLFPDEYSGRVFTAINLCTWSGVFLLQSLTGAIIDMCAVDEIGRSPSSAYRVMFAVLAIGLVIVLLIYRKVEDVTPSSDTNTENQLKPIDEIKQ